jgi:hypothetical protein
MPYIDRAEALPCRALSRLCRALPRLPGYAAPLPGRVAPYQAAYVLLRIVSDKVSVNAALSLQSVLWSKNHSGFAWAQAIDFWMTLLFQAFSEWRLPYSFATRSAS